MHVLRSLCLAPGITIGTELNAYPEQLCCHAAIAMQVEIKRTSNYRHIHICADKMSRLKSAAVSLNGAKR